MRRRLATLARSTFRSLERRNVRLYLVGQTTSQIGMWMQLIALSLLVFDLTDDGTAVGLVTAAQFGPVLVLGGWAGILSDRLDRHRLLVISSVAGMVVAATLAAIELTGHTSLWAVYLLAVATGVVFAIENPVRRAFVGDLVEDTEVPNAVALNSALLTSARVVGPAVAGAVITSVGVGWCFAINAATFVPQLWCFARMDRDAFATVGREPGEPGRGRQALAEAVRYVGRRPEMLWSLIVAGCVGATALNLQVILPLFAERDLSGDAATFSLLYATASAGSVAGALVVAHRADVEGRYVMRRGLALAVATLVLAAAPNTAVALVLVIPVGALTVQIVSATNALLQVRAAAPVRGRVLALMSVVVLGTTPLGAPVTGYVSERFGARIGLVLVAAVAAAGAALGLRALAHAAAAAPMVLAAPGGPIDDGPAVLP